MRRSASEVMNTGSTVEKIAMAIAMPYTGSGSASAESGLNKKNCAMQKKLATVVA